MHASIQEGSTSGSERFRVADLLVDIGRQRVTRAGAEVALPKLSFDLLRALIRAAPNVVSSHELMVEVWSGLVVSPETVSQRVKLLRDALGDDPQAPRYVAGLRGRGYRLLPDAEALAPERASALEPRSATAGRRDRWPIAAAGLAAAALAIIATLVLAALRPRPDAALQSPPDSVVVAGLPPRTVAVLPFENLSPDPANEYLALGMAHMVLDRLAGVREIVVIARSSSFRLGGASGDAQSIGRKLGARYLVEGSVQRLGEQLRVTARLVDAGSGAQLESLRFDRPLSEIFVIQDEIADRVAAALEAKLRGAVVPRAVSGARSANLDAYLAFLQGRTLLAKFTVGAFEEAAQHFERALALDPGFAAAYVGLADARMGAAWRRQQWERGGTVLAPLVARAAPLVDRALELDPGLGAAYLWRAQWLDGPTEQIEADFRRGLALAPSHGPGLAAYVDFLLHAERLAEARAALDRALLVDPLSARTRYLRAHLSLESGDSEAIEAQLLEVLQIDPGFTSALTLLGIQRWLGRGEFAEGLKLVERAAALDPQDPWPRHTARMIHLDLGDPAAARALSEATPESAASPRFQLLQYLGDRQGAGRAAHRFQEGNTHSWQSTNAPAAVRDLALATGDYRPAIRFIEAGYGLAEPRRLSNHNILTAIVLVHLLQASGQRASAAKLLENIFVWLDRGRPVLAFNSAARHRVRAHALILRGERDAALAELAAAFRSGDRALWWYTLERDPLWAPLRTDPRFQAIAAEARAHAAQQRALLAGMRRRGEVMSSPWPLPALNDASPP